MTLLKDASGTAGLSYATLVDVDEVNALVASHGVAAAAGDSTTDDTAALQAKADHASSSRMLKIPARTYKISSTIRFTGPVDARGAIFSYTGSGNAVVIGNADGSPINKIDCYLPKVVKTSKTWGSDVGVRVESVFESHIWVPHVQSFGCGLDLVGGPGPSASRGTSYCTFYVGHLDDNKINQRLQPQSTAAWVNQNTFIGGRWSHNTGGVTSGTRHILLVNQTSGQQPNNNTWVNPSIETPDAVEYALYIDGANNQWLNARFEGSDASFGKVRFEGADVARPSKKNKIDGGFDSLNVTYELGSNVGANEVRETGGRHLMVGGTAAGYLNLANINSVNSPSLLVGDASDLLTADLTSAYYVSLAAGISKYKAKADTASRWEMTHTTGQLVRGSGSSTALTSFLHGSGSPEGVQTAGVGSIYQDRAGVGLKSIYYKALGSGNTGWQPLQERSQTIATNADFTLTPHTSAERTLHTGTLTADRTITLSTTNAQNGQTFKVTRTGSGAFNLIVGGLKNLATSQWCEVTFDGTAWYLSQFGSL